MRFEVSLDCSKLYLCEYKKGILEWVDGEAGGSARLMKRG